MALSRLAGRMLPSFTASCPPLQSLEQPSVRSVVSAGVSPVSLVKRRACDPVLTKLRRLHVRCLGPRRRIAAVDSVSNNNPNHPYAPTRNVSSTTCPFNDDNHA
uniref:Uncharacterized protein n=1 Tax=Rhipicephalus appendiculatus TaxID=34631 RepID=A0A131Y9I7_RHIAP